MFFRITNNKVFKIFSLKVKRTDKMIIEKMLIAMKFFKKSFNELFLNYFFPFPHNFYLNNIKECQKSN